ncbi:flagellin [Thalassolituus oleivorans]|uniref:flagellin N-terminal helical domain-containing protein n=1 Tax=Thalassolituus oleivorans TaxID=187493 RepID=UPI00240A61FD|nr:flagellin [Thalassolituus oleivorans]MDF1642020.1 flagellin [Thalassolituus oleivorans]
MPQIINTNIASLNAQRNLDKSQSSNQQALQRLSSGLRINSAKDDAAGLAISTRFTSQIKGLNVAVRNAGDGIALAQTAEGALGSINENLQRVRELAVQSANATNSDVDRDALQAEVDQLVAEITRTSEETDFNGRKLLDGSFSATFQVGANAGQTVDVSIAELTSNKLGSSSQSGLSARGTDNALENGDLVINGVAIAASRAEDDTSSVANNSASAISKVAAINRYSDETGVSAQVSENVAGGSEMSAVAGSGTFTLNGVDISFSTTTDAAQTRAAISQAINAVSDQTGVKAVDTDSASTGVNLIAEDGRNITLTFDTADLSTITADTFASATGLAGGADNGGSGTVYTNTYEGGYTLIADGDQKSIDISGGNGTGRGDLANAGLTAGSYDRAVAASVSSKVADSTQASAINGGTLNNTLERTDVGGTFISQTGGSVTSTVGAAATTAVLSAGTVSFTISQGTTALVFSHTAGDISIAETAFRAQDAATTAGVNVDFYEQASFDLGALTDGAAFSLGGVTINVAGTSAEARAESVVTQLNAANDAAGFAAEVGANGFVHAELNSAGDTVSITVRNDTSTSVSAQNLNTGSLVEIGGTALNGTAGTASFLSGELAFSATSISSGPVNVVATDTGSSLLAGAGSLAGESVSGSVLTSTSDTNISVTVGGTDVSPSTPLAAGSTVAQLASAVNGVEGVNAYEEISLDITASTLTSGEQLRFSDGTTDIDVTLTPDSAGNFTLQSLADDINGTDFSSANMDVSAVYDPAGNSGAGSISVSVRNFSANTVTIESENADGAGVVVSQGGGTFIGEQQQALSGELKFFSADGQDVTVTLSDPETGGELFTSTNDSETYSGVNGLQDGDLLINGVTIGAADVGADKASATVSSDGSKILSSEKGQSAIAIASAINKVSAETGVTAEVNATEVVGGDGTNVDLTQFEEGDQAGIYINGVEVGTVTLQNDGSGTLDSDRARADALNLINQNAGKTGVTATDNGVSLTLTAADGRNVSIAIDDKSGSDASIGAIMGLDAAKEGIGEATFGAASAGGVVSAEGAAYETTYGTVKLSSASEFTLEGGANGNGELDALGLKTGTYGGGEDGQFLSDIDISTFEGATAAITAIDNAIGQVASQRADLGAIQNRLESTVSNLQVTSENLNSANSRIQDADFAAETAELSRTQVLQQAGISVLAQANAAGQQVLSLLG